MIWVILHNLSKGYLSHIRDWAPVMAELGSCYGWGRRNRRLQTGKTSNCIIYIRDKSSTGWVYTPVL